MKKKIFGIVFAFLIFLKGLDYLLMEKLYFLFPNEMEWDSSPWYNFLDYTKKIEFGEEETGVLAVGSSIALYSVLPSVINEKNEDFRLDLYSHVAMAPTDVHYYLDDIISKNPKLVVYVFNPADFQMEFVDLDKEKKEEKEAQFDSGEWLRHFSWRHPARLIYPFAFAWDYFGDLRKNEIYRLWGKGFLYTNRYREFFWDPMDAYIERHYRRGRSYHIYTGSVPEEGIWQHGWTGKKFSLLCTASEGVWEDSLFVPLADTEVEVEYEDGTRESFQYPKSGWQKIRIQPGHGKTKKSEQSVPPGFSGFSVQAVRFHVSQTYSSRLAENKPYGKEYEYGVRLSQNFCTKDRDRDFSYIRPQFLEEDRFRNMSLSEYREDYRERMYRDNDKRPELYRMKALSDAKIYLRDREFQPWIEMERFLSIRDRLEEVGIPLVLVLSPENPIELEKYAGGRWHSAMLDWFGELGQGRFYDHSSFFKDPRNFSDPHHLTYYGSMDFSEQLKSIIRKELELTRGEENE